MVQSVNGLRRRYHREGRMRYSLAAGRGVQP